MANLDAIITFGIIVAAAIYLYRRFAGAKDSKESGCASGGACSGCGCGNSGEHGHSVTKL